MVSLPKCAQSTWPCSPGKVRRRRYASAAGRGRSRATIGAEVIGRAGVTALAHHRVQARGPQRRVLGQRLGDEREIRLDHRGAHRLRAPAPRPARARAARCRDARAVGSRWCPPASARCDAGAGSRLRARAGSSPGSSRHGPPRNGPNRAKRGSAARRSSSARAAETRERSAARCHRDGGSATAAWSAWCPADRGRSRRHYGRAERLRGTLMRHFLRLPRAPRALPRRVATRSAVALLVAGTGAAQRLAPANPRALRRAVLVAAVAVPTDAHLLRAAPATVQPIALLARPHAPRTQRWTTPRNAGIKEAQTRPYAARACRRPGVLPGMCPGLRLSGVRAEHSAAEHCARLSAISVAVSSPPDVHHRSDSLPRREGRHRPPIRSRSPPCRVSRAGRGGGERTSAIDGDGIGECRCNKCKKGIVIAEIAPDDAIEWFCESCGHEGRISNWRRSFWDLSALTGQALTLTPLNSATRDSGVVARQPPKSRGFRSPLTSMSTPYKKCVL